MRRWRVENRSSYDILNDDMALEVFRRAVVARRRERALELWSWSVFHLTRLDYGIGIEVQNAIPYQYKKQ